MRTSDGKLPAASGPAGDPALAQAQQAGTVRADVGIAEVMALLSAACQGALRAGWDRDLQDRTLAIIFAGLRPAAAP